MWALSSDGREFSLQAECRRFELVSAHHFFAFLLEMRTNSRLYIKFYEKACSSLTVLNVNNKNGFPKSRKPANFLLESQTGFETLALALRII